MVVDCITVSFFGGDAGIGLTFKKLSIYGVILLTVIALLLAIDVGLIPMTMPLF